MGRTSKNHHLEQMLRSYGIDSVDCEDWILPYGRLPAFRCLWDPEAFINVGQLDIHILCEKGAVIEDSFAGTGKGDAGFDSAFDAFTATSFPVLLAAFWGKRSKGAGGEFWEINGGRYEAFIGDFGISPANGMQGMIPATALSELVNAIKSEKLDYQMHWIRTLVTNYGGEHLYEASLDDDQWPSGEAALQQIPWEKSDRYYAIRNFAILRQVPSSAISGKWRHKHPLHSTLWADSLPPAKELPSAELLRRMEKRPFRRTRSLA